MNVVMTHHMPARPRERITRDGLPWPRVSRGHQPPCNLEAHVSNNQDVFWQLGRDAKSGGALPPPYDGASARM